MRNSLGKIVRVKVTASLQRQLFIEDDLLKELGTLYDFVAIKGDEGLDMYRGRLKKIGVNSGNVKFTNVTNLLNAKKFITRKFSTLKLDGGFVTTTGAAGDNNYMLQFGLNYLLVSIAGKEVAPNG